MRTERGSERSASPATPAHPWAGVGGPEGGVTASCERDRDAAAFFGRRQCRRWTPTILFRRNDRNGKTSLHRLTKNRHDIRQVGQVSFTTFPRYARFSFP